MLIEIDAAGTVCGLLVQTIQMHRIFTDSYSIPEFVFLEFSWHPGDSSGIRYGYW